MEYLTLLLIHYFLIVAILPITSAASQRWDYGRVFKRDKQSFSKLYTDDIMKIEEVHIDSKVLAFTGFALSLVGIGLRTVDNNKAA